MYQIQYASALATNSDGSTAWQVLYDNYPSQGTNTFWLDTGNYNLSPQILHPKYMPMRFYRILDEGSDSTTDEPTVAINTPTNNTIASGEITITVTAFTDQPVLSGTKLYVNGQEMPMADTTTNYTDITGVTNYEVDTYNINTCEWLNTTNILFATAECQTGRGDLLGSGPIATGHGVSPFVSAIFNNLVEGISFSQPTFDPSSGQTQQVTAFFPLNSDWTLNIVDINSNIVQTATGSGNSMLYNWDGTANGTNLPNGIYYYYITAATNGLANEVVTGGGGGGGGGGGVPSPSFARSSSITSDVLQMWAVPADSESVLPLAIFPPGFDTNGFTIFAATPAQIESLRPAVSRSTSVATMDSGGGASPNGIGDPGYITPLPNPQPAPPAPQRPPNNPVRGLAGTFGVAYDTYSANGTNSINCAILSDGSGAGTHISMQSHSASTPLSFAPLVPYKTEVNNFVSQMQHWGWQNSFLKVDDQLQISQLRGSGTPFNNVSIGVLFTHGVYGTSVDFAANQCKQMYFPITSGASAQYLRLSEMNLGGSGTNGLKWMALNSCRSLYQANWNSMKNAGIKPYNGNLHLLLGENTDGFTSSLFGWYWAKYISYGTSTNAGSYSPLTIRSAWYQAAHDAYHNVAFPGGTTISYAVAGDSACHDDTVQTNATPTGTWFYDSQQVFP